MRSTNGQGETVGETTQRLSDNIERGRRIQLIVDGEAIPAYEGETIATALLAAGRRTFRHTVKGAPRGIFCGIGVCFDCLVQVDDAQTVRACVTPARDGMRVGTGVR